MMVRTVYVLAGICVLIFSVSVAATEVCTPTDLNNVRNDLTGEYVQVCDIDLTNIDFDPIGDGDTPFSGTFDGNGHSITGFVYHSSNSLFAGLFGRLANATVKNVTAIDFDVFAYQNVGTMVGHMFLSTIDNCHAYGGTSDGIYQWIGGLIGHIHPGCVVSNSSANVGVFGGQKVGGLAGNHHGSIIRDCFSRGNVNGMSYSGGLVGYCQLDSVLGNQTVILRSHATGQVSGDFRVGGLVGNAESNTHIYSSRAHGNVFACDDPNDLSTCDGSYAGGLIGYCSNTADGQEITVANCYATGDSIGQVRCGGLIGYALHTDIIESNASGNVIVLDEGASYGGGLIGYLDGSSIYKSFAMGSVLSGGQYAGGLVGKMDNGGSIAQSYASGDVLATERQVGGLIGNIQSNQNALVMDSYAMGTVESLGMPLLVGSAGGIVGGSVQGTEMINCFSASYVFAENNGSAGGLTGGSSNNGTIISSYWDIIATDQDSACGSPSLQCTGDFEGYPTSQMGSPDSYDGWDFDTVWEFMGMYPTLQWQNLPFTLNHFAFWNGCVTDLNQHCSQLDRNNDGNIDLLDFRELQIEMTNSQ